ncbi:MAG: hypothetical protein R3D30_09550 [Hyphomicrobiales bacterium]
MSPPSLWRSNGRMVRNAFICAALLPLAAGLFACADRESIRAERVAEQAAAEAEDDEVCRGRAEPGSDAYNTCRQSINAERARKAEIDYQKRRDFDRVLGGLDDL